MSKSNGNAKILDLILLAIFGVGIGLAATIMAFVVFSGIFVKMHLSFWTVVPLSTVAVSIGCFVSGLMIARKIKTNGLFCGFCSGILFFAIYLIGAMFNGVSEITAIVAIKLVSFVFAGCLGGYIGVLRSTKNLKVKRF